VNERIRVISYYPEFPGSTIWIGIGVTDDGRYVRFAGDWRPMRDIAEDLEAGGAVWVVPEAWQILGIDNPTRTQ